MKIKCKLISFKGKKESLNKFEFELDDKTPIADTDDTNRSIVMISGNPYTIALPYEHLQQLKEESKTDKDATRDYT